MAEAASSYSLSEDQIDSLNSLIQLDIDAIHAYGEAIEKEDSPDVRSRLAEFKGDHQRHVEELSNIVRASGAMPPDFSLDFKGYLIEGFTRIRSSMGAQAPLKAMRMNERITNASYERALSYDMPPEIRDIIQRNREDERRHLSYIEDSLDKLSDY